MNLKFWQKTSVISETLRTFSNFENLVYSGISKTKEQLTSLIENIAVCIEKINMDLENAIVSLEQIQEAYTYLKTQPDVLHTPTLQHVQSMFPKLSPNTHQENILSPTEDDAFLDCDLYIKMENMQTTGSFKIRGVLNQMRRVQEKHGKQAKLVTMSAGNYGKAFAYALRKVKAKAMCVMPSSAPANRAALIEKMGVEVRKTTTGELQSEVDRLVAEEGYIFCHPFDDVDLIAGYASSALELLEDVPEPDVVVVNCGGGALVSGVGAGISLTGHKNCRVYGVEPEGAASMFQSFQERRPITLSEAKSVASGLAPPYAGTLCYRHCRWFLEDVLLVSDEEILRTMKLLYQRGIIAEPSGCAALAAILTGKVPNIKGKKVVVYISGRNVTQSEIQKLIPEDS